MFVGVQMTATCAPDASGKHVQAQGIIGATVPGAGTITLPSGCVLPIVLQATGTGKMRPLGAKSDGTENVDYDPAVNLPISTIFATPPTAGSLVTANPVTTLVQYMISINSLLTVAEAKSKVELALGLDSGDADRDYTDPNVAQATSRLAAMTALTALKLSTDPTVLQGKTYGQFVANALAASVINGKSLNNAANIALALQSQVDLTTDPAVTGGEIDNDATIVYNMLVKVQNLEQLALDPTAASHLVEVRKIAAQNAVVQAVRTSANATALATTRTALAAADAAAKANVLLAGETPATAMGCKVTVPSTDTTTKIRACYINLTQEQCTAMQVWDTRIGDYWVNNATVTREWVVTSLVDGEQSCATTYPLAENFATVKTADDVKAPPATSGGLILVKN